MRLSTSKRSQSAINEAVENKGRKNEKESKQQTEGKHFLEVLLYSEGDRRSLGATDG